MDQIIVVVYLVCIFALGIWGGKGVKTLSQFSVAGRSYGTFIIFATLSASFIGGGFSMGNAEKVFLFGIVNIFALYVMYILKGNLLYHSLNDCINLNLAERLLPFNSPPLTIM